MFTGTLSRCIESLEQSDKSSHESLATTEAFRQVRHAYISNISNGPVQQYQYLL